MAEDALPKDERRQTMKRIIAILLALIMIFAFAACKSKDDKNDTTAESSQDANADVQDTQAGDAESNAAESTADDSTAVAPSEGGSEAATQGQQGGQQGNKPAAEIKAPVNGSKAEIVAFFNKYASAMKSYTGKVSVKRVQGTTSKINSLNPDKILGIDLIAKAEPLLPNDYPKTATKTFNGGKASDGTTLASFLPAAKRASYKVDPAGVKAASCVKQGNGWKVSITLVTESGEGLTFVPKHHGSCFDTLSLTPDDFKPFSPKSTKVNYQSGTFTFVLNADGTLASINVSEPANVVCKLTFGNSNVGIDANFTGTWQQQYTFAY